MQISVKDWNRYIGRLNAINEKAAAMMREYVQKNGLDDVEKLIQIANGIATKYGEAAASVTCDMYEAIAEAQGVTVRAAEPARTPSMEETSNVIRSALKRAPSTVPEETGKLVKKTSTRTMRKNAARDGAMMALVPGGDGCAFCMMIASRGWQSARSDKTFDAHLHKNCKCEYVVRFKDNLSVEGYDPDAIHKEFMELEGKDWNERVNAMRRKLDAEKNKMDYRHQRDESSTLIAKSKEENISAKQVIGSPNGIYLSDKLVIKPKKIQEIENDITEFKKIIGVKGKAEPRVIIVDVTEIGNAGGRFDAETNTIFYKVLQDKKTQRHVTLHELYHWDDAQDYISRGNKITTNGELINWESQRAKRILDKLKITADNVINISSYARDAYRRGRFDEVYTEYRTIKSLGGLT